MITKTRKDEILKQRQKVDDFEELIKSMPGSVEGDSDSFPLHHMFGGGIYLREILLPAGSTCVGKIHKTKHPNFILKGKCIVTSNVSNDPIMINAPAYFFSDVGVKKVVHAIEDTTWVTVHITDKDDPVEVEDEIIAKDYSEIEHIINKELT